MTGLDALLEALPVSCVLRRRPILRCVPGRTPAVAAERLVVSRRMLAAELGPAAEDDHLLRHAADQVAARLPGSVFSPGAAGEAGGIPARVPVLLPFPLGGPLGGMPVAAPRPGLIGVLPLAALAGPPLAERRAELASLGWRLGIGELDAAALRLVPLAALEADLLLLRWSPDLARQRDALRGADTQALVLTGCDDAEAVRWGQDAGLVLFGGSRVEATLAVRS